MTIITGGSGDDSIKGGSGADILSGGDGDDFLQGKAGGDTIDGGKGNDQIQGNEGDDYLIGGEGDDFIHGGIGIDRAFYTGSVKDYSYYRDGENFYINHSGGTGLDGNDRLLHVERLIFADAVIDLTQNNAPIAYNDTASTDEDNSVSGNVLANDFDWEGDSMSATPGTFTGVYGTLVLNADGSYTYTPHASSQSLAQGQVVQDVFTYTVSDGSLSDTGTLTVNVSGNNDAPVANPDAASTGENSIVVVNVIANDTDVDNGATLTVIAASAPSGQGSASIVGNQVQFDPGTDFDYLDTGESAQVVVSYTIEDEHGATSSSTITITVNGANDAPVANDDTASTTEDASVSGNVLANDTDVDVEPLTVANPGTYVGANGTLVLNSDGSYTYTPNAGAQALDDGETAGDVFSYTASDGTASDTATLTVTVNGANDAPVANDDTASTSEDSSVSGNVLANDTDVDVEPLTVTTPGTYVGSYGTLAIAADGSYTYTPSAAVQGLDVGETAQDVFAYTASDGTASDSANLTVTVTGLNDAPVANDDTASTTEDASVSGNVLANDTDVDVEPLTVANPGTYVGANGTLVLNADGSYTYTPNAGAQALDDGETAGDVFSYTASDGTASDTATLTVTVNGANDAPVANDDTAITNEDSGGVSGNVLTNDTDIDGETLTVAAPGTYVGTYGTLTIAANGSYTYTPGAGAQGLDVGETAQDVFTYNATDGTTSDSATLTVTVTGLNDAPVANDDTNSTDENTPISGNVLTNDTDVDGETLTVVNAATFIGAYGTLVLASNGSYTYTPGAAAQALLNGQTANDVFTYIASDGTVSDTATLTITVNGLSGVPNAVDDTATTNEDSAVSGNVLTNDTDAENDPLTVSDPGTYTGTYGTLVLNSNGSYTYTPNAAADGLAAGESAQDVFSYTATDGTASDTASLTITINGTNDAPTIDAGGTDDSGSVTELPDGDPNEGITIHSQSGDVAFDDLDLSDTHSASFTPQGAFYLGTFSLDPVNQAGDSVGWDFTVSDAALEGLSEGEIRIQTYEIEIDDGNGGTVTQDVTITITGAGVGSGPQTVWYIDNTAVGSANVGTAADPYTSIAAFNAAQGSLGGPQAGHTVHLLAGTGTGVYAEADGINLLNGQILVGDANGAIRPTITTTGGDGINVAQNNNVSGIDIGNTSGADIADSGGTVGNLTISDVGSSGTGRIIDVDQGGTIDVTLNSAESLSSSGGAIDLNAVGGSFTVTGATTIAGATGGGVDVTSGTNLAVDFQGGLTVSSGSTTAVNFSGNMGSSTLDIAGLSLTTTTGTALNVSSGGTVEVTGTGNTIATTGGTAVNISFATIGASGVTLESVSSIGGSATGIILNTAGSGGFEVTGSGSIAGSGGTIANKTGADGVAPGQGVGVYINATSNVSLANMAITGNSNGGVVGTNVTDFTLTDSTLTNNGSGASEGAVVITGLTGTSALLGNVIGGSSGDNVHIAQTGGSLNLTIADSADDQAIMGTVNNATGNDSVFVGTTGNASLTLLVDGVDFQGAKGDLLQVLAEDNSTQVVTITDNGFNNTQAGAGGGVTLSGGGAGSNINVDFFVEDNSFTGAIGGALSAVYGQQSGMVRGNIEGNTIGIDDGIAGGQGSQTGSAIFVSLDKPAGAGDAGFQVNIVNNNINDIEGIAGIYLRSNGGDFTDTAVMEATISGNTLDEFGDFVFAGLVAQIGGSGQAIDAASLGLALSDNIIDLSDADFGGNAVYIDQSTFESHYYMPGYTGSPDGEGLGGMASVDLDAFWTGLGNVFTNGGFPAYAGGVDATVTVGIGGEPLVFPAWP
ncbi:MAG TPA: Ig-like domain-containing protein [Allosphingosinicella sp.]